MILTIAQIIISSAFAANTPYYASCPDFPTLRHDSYPEDHAENVTFNADIHLAI